jgi:hypothetical protein
LQKYNKTVYSPILFDNYWQWQFCIRQKLVFGAPHCLENELRAIVLWRHNYCGKLSKSVDPIHTSAGTELTGLLISAKWGDHPYCENTTTFFWGFFGDCSVESGYWPSWSPDLVPTDFLLWTFLTVHKHNPRWLDDYEDKIKQAICNGGQQTLQNTARNTLKRAIVSLQNGVPHFHHLL